MVNSVQSIPLGKLVGHPDNANRMSGENIRRLVRNIERSGRYEPLVVRPHPQKEGFYQIINGHHRVMALGELGYKEADAVVWDIDDEQADILLATLNRLCGSDELGKKVRLLKRLRERMEAGELAKLLPQMAGQIERLTELKGPRVPVKISAEAFAVLLVFFVNGSQKQVIEKAIALVGQAEQEKTKAGQNAAALTYIAQKFIEQEKV